MNHPFMRTIFSVSMMFAVFVWAAPVSAETLPVRVMEDLGRGVVAVNRGEDVFVSWRLLGTEPQDTAFNVYRHIDGGEPERINDAPLTGGTNLVDAEADLSRENAYSVRAVVDGEEESGEESAAFVLPADSPTRQHLEVPLEPLSTEHLVTMAWVGDLDGDGEYEVVVSRRPTGEGHETMPYILEAYDLDGSFLWRVDLGPNSVRGRRWVNPPAAITYGHNDNVTVYDIASDGRAEVMVTTAAGTVFGDGRTLEHDDPTQQFISVLDGQTGAEISRIPVDNPWPEASALAGHFGIMHLDGVYPSLVFKAKNRNADGSFNLIVHTWDFRDGALVPNWTYKPEKQHANFHQIRIIDIDGDGRDELADGGYVLDDDGSELYVLEGIVHGDRFHIGKLDPDRPGLQGFGVQQNHPEFLLYYYYDATTGEILRKHYGERKEDIGRGMAGDIDPRHRGYEYWAFSGVYNAPTGEKLAEDDPWPNFRIWWDGDAGSELLNGTHIDKWDPEAGTARRLFSAHHHGATHIWRSAPVFYGDILGDWREEVIYEHSDRDRLLIFTTTIPTDIRLYTLPHNPAYRAGMTVKGYMQSHMVDYFLGFGMDPPPPPRITTPKQLKTD